MIFPFDLILKTEEDTKLVAKQFSEVLKEGDVIALTGNLGSGKTFFVKAICQQFEITNASSPSFAIVNTYDGSHSVNHFDFYRLKKVEELYDIGFGEYLNEDSITFIEWADMFPELLPKNYYRVNIEIQSESNRKITVTKK